MHFGHRISIGLGYVLHFTEGGPTTCARSRALTWDPPAVFEHEWKVEPRPELPAGESAVIRWELRRDGGGTMLHLEHRNLNRETELGFAPGTHAFLDRFASQLSGQPLPDWWGRSKGLPHDIRPPGSRGEGHR